MSSTTDYHASVEIGFNILNVDEYMALSSEERQQVGDAFCHEVFGSGDEMTSLMENGRWLDQNLVTVNEQPLSESRIRAGINSCLVGFNDVIRNGLPAAQLPPDGASEDGIPDIGVRYVWVGDIRVCIYEYPLYLIDSGSQATPWKLSFTLAPDKVIEAYVWTKLAWSMESANVNSMANAA
ncbi:MAG: hypothetical protein DWQ01_16370 [Planctomycetota bacterium]|nr:MAG: hypothetical protein DWQ01_16370 [Planctomycetota bacterium]